MQPDEPAERVQPGSRLWVVAACSAPFVVVVLFLLVDLRTSVHEARVLHAGVVCTQGTYTDCVAQTPVELGPYNDARGTRMVDVFVQDLGADPDDSDLVVLMPADYGEVFGFGARATAHRVDGRVVALSRAPDEERVPMALTSVHAVLVDTSFALVLAGLLARGLGTLLVNRRAGVGWSDRMTVTLGVRRRRTDLLMLVGGFGGIVAFVLATYDVRAWVTAAVLGGLVWWGPRVERRLRGTGRHAA